MADTTIVPGATTSGFILPSAAGPLLENAAMPFLLSATRSELNGAESVGLKEKIWSHVPGMFGL
jgi:hypothetical protein